MLRILFVLPYKEMEEIVKSVFQEVLDQHEEEISYIIWYGKTGEILEIGPGQADVVIARGFTAAHMKTSLPKIELQTSAFDMLRAVQECIRLYQCEKIALVGINSMVYGAQSLNELQESVQIVGKVLTDSERLDEVITELRNKGTEAVIGGNSVSESAERVGLPHVMMRSGKESVYHAVEEAILAIEVSRQEREKREYLQTIMDYSFEGIVSTDLSGQILSINRFAVEKICELRGQRLKNAEQLIGCRIADYFPEIHLDEELTRTLVTSGKRRFMVNCIRLQNQETSGGWIITFRDIENIQKDEGNIRKQLHNKGLRAKYHFENVICGSRVMKETIRIAEKYARTDSNVFIHGETGTGKELFAQSIHNASNRRNGPFVAINCAALPESLLESELFGYTEGAFTGAAKGGKAGLFELAHNGTLFLDEIGDMAINLQARLLRVIQEREIMRLGGNQVIPVDVRIIAAANKDMHAAVMEGTFRQDLLYRIDVLRLELPPLRERRMDILNLADYFIGHQAQKNGSILRHLDQDVQNWVIQQPWEGNVRELRNFCERLSVLCEKELASMADIRNASGYDAKNSTEKASLISEKNSESEHIREMLERCGYSRKNTAAALGIDTSTLWRKMKKYHIDCK